MKSVITIAFSLLFSGCIAIPYPHQAVPNANITGRIVDADSGTPLKDINIRLRSTGLSTKTNETGKFEFKARKKWYYFVMIPLAPIDQFPLNDTLEIYDTDGKRRKEKTYYRKTTIEVNSIIYPSLPVIGTKRNNENLKRYENLGDVRVQKINKKFSNLTSSDSVTHASESE